MAWTNITADEITTGEPVKSETLQKVKGNLESLDSRITDVESGNNTIYPPIILRVNGNYGDIGTITIPATAVLKTTLNFNLTITGVRLIIDHAGSAGTTEVDLKFRRGAGSYTSILTTKPSVIYSAGDDATSTNAVLNPSYVNLLAGDILALDISQAQTNGRSFLVRIDYIKS